MLEQDGETSYGLFDSASAKPNNSPTGAPTIMGTARVGETLTVDISGISDADGLDNATFEYWWMINDTYLWKPDDAPRIQRREIKTVTTLPSAASFRPQRSMTAVISKVSKSFSWVSPLAM